MSTPGEIYRQKLEAGDLLPDDAQQRAVRELERCFSELIASGPPPRGWRRKLYRFAGTPPPRPKGVYLWGGVGRGKTLLMDAFYGCLPFEDRLRQHFHRFMNSIHGDLKRLRHQENPLQTTADDIADRTRVICFDEFAVADIADAMILGNLFEALFERGVTLVATSNSKPTELYSTGLQRRRFLPAIDLIEANTVSVHVDGDTDYRLRVLERAAVYQYPIGQEAERELANCFAAIAPDGARSDTHISVLGRSIACRKEADGVVWFDFPQICDGPRSQDDYIEISRCYHTVIVSNVPQFTRTLENQARRFIALVDEFYDRRVKLVLSAAAAVNELYAGERVRLEFQRTRSRLEEMQSHDYLAAPHVP
ncbi:MAG TPA: cell division protein ZapE [Gammaproteobacteria bacterium]